MDPRDFLDILRGRWLAISLFAVLGLALAAGFTALSPKVYTSTARLYVSFAGETADDRLSAGAQITARMTDYTLIPKTPTVLEAAQTQLGGPLSARTLADSISVSNTPRTNTLAISSSTSSPQTSADIANAVAQQTGPVLEALETPPGDTVSAIKVTVIQPAVPAGAPSSPNVKINLALGLFLGLGLGVAYAVLRAQLDTSVREPAQLERLTGARPLAVVSRHNEADASPVITSGESGSRTDDFRRLRANMAYVDVDHAPKVIAVTSPSATEGKSTVAANLAITLAVAGARVVLLDADFRRPALADYLDLSHSPGLADILAHRESWQRTATPWSDGLITVIPEGESVPNATELLQSTRMIHLLADLRKTHDYVIVDCPPVLPFADAAVIATQCDGALLLARHGHTQLAEVHDAIGALAAVGARVLGTVLTFAPRSRSGAYRYHYYDGPREADGQGPTAIVFPPSDRTSEPDRGDAGQLDEAAGTADDGVSAAGTARSGATLATQSRPTPRRRSLRPAKKHRRPRP